MGFIFSGKRTYFRDLSFLQLLNNTFRASKSARKSLMFATNYDVELFMSEYHKYKADYKRTFNARKLDKIGYSTLSTSLLPVIDSERVFNAVEAIDDEVKVIKTYQKRVIISDMIRMLEYFKNNLSDTYDPISYNNSEYLLRCKRTSDGRIFTMMVHSMISPYADNLFNVEESEEAGTLEQRCDINWLRVTLSHPDEIVKYDIFDPQHVYNNGTIVEDDDGYAVYSISSSRVFKDVIVYSRATVDGNLYYLLLPLDTIRYIEGNENLETTPVLTVKDDKFIKQQTNEYRFKHNMMLKMFGVDIDDMRDMITTNSIDDLKLGIAVSVIPTNPATNKYLYNFFKKFQLSGTPIDYSRPTYSERTIEDNVTTSDTLSTQFLYDMITQDGEIIRYRFNAYFDIIEGTISSKKYWRVEITDIMYNYETYGREVRDIYNSAIGTNDDDISDMTINDLVNDLEARLRVIRREDTVDSNADIVEAVNSLPYNAGSAKLSSEFIYVYCKEYEIADKCDKHIKYEYDGNIVTHRIIGKYTETNKNLSNEYSYQSFYFPHITHTHHIVTDDGSGQPNDWYTDDRTSNSVIQYQKQLTPNSIGVITLTNYSLEYLLDNHTINKVPIFGHVEDFRFVATRDIFDGITFNEFVMLYETSLCGFAYTVRSTYVKWYQTSAFSMFVQFVLVVITVATAGAATPATSTASALLSVAESVAMSYAVSLAGQYIAKEIGGTFGALIATVAVVTAMYYGGSFDDGMASADLWFKSAETFLQMENVIIAEEMEKFNKDHKGELEKIYNETTELRKKTGEDSSILIMTADINNAAYPSSEIIDMELYKDLDSRTTIPNELFEIDSIIEAITTVHQGL
jgi:hypothetical protein